MIAALNWYNLLVVKHLGIPCSLLDIYLKDYQVKFLQKSLCQEAKAFKIYGNKKTNSNAQYF